jgi:transcriptional regulator with XRE-family HTH domain
VVKLTRLKLIRERKALTQDQLARLAGVSRITVARLEAGVDEPRPTTTRKLADALGVQPEALMDPLD